MRGLGTLYRKAGSRFWWVQYWHEGTRYRESSECEKLRLAQDFLRNKLSDLQSRPANRPGHELLVRDLYTALEHDYSINQKKSIRNVTSVWQNHLAEYFGNEDAAQLSADHVTNYIMLRQRDGAKNATINRELAALKRMYTLAIRTRKLTTKPYIPQLEERNVRKGFVKDGQYDAMARETGKIGLWLRAMFEVACTYTWRKTELLEMRVRKVDLGERTLGLDAGETKNDDPRLVKMTSKVHDLLRECVAGKGPDDFVFTRDGQRIVDFRDAWVAVCKAAGCPGLLFHDLRRTGARNMRRLGIPEGVIMKIGGWRTRSVFERYNIIDEQDLEEASGKLDRAAHARRQQQLFDHQVEMFGSSEKKPPASQESPPRKLQKVQ